MKKLVSILAIILATTTSIQANPIPWPWPATGGMLFENIYVEIEPDTNGLHAVFTGRFVFTPLPSDVNSILFPVPTDANNIHVWRFAPGPPMPPSRSQVSGDYGDYIELAWSWSSEQYPTILPEMPEIPMIEWQGPFPADGAFFRVDYEHNLIKRSNESIFFYALGTDKYFPEYDKTTVARFEILLPENYVVKGVWLDETPHTYEVVDSNLILNIDSISGPIINDLIISLVPRHFEGCGVLVQGVECVLFQADTGGLYVLDNIGGFQVGDRVWVRGIVNPYCATICMQGNTCIQDNIISACPEEGGAGKPELSKHYVPYDSPIEPNAPGYTLPLNLNDVANYAAMESKFKLASVAPILEQNGFAIIEYDFGWSDPNRDDIVKPYKNLQRMDVPLFITADTLLHLYHVQFDETLKDVEQREFVSDINDLTAALLNEALTQYERYAGDLKEAAKRNIAYLAVAQKLIEPEAQVPDPVTNLVASELAKIDAHQGFAPSDIFIYQEDYSQYVPRGHYTRSEELKRYFRTLMWYGRMAFLLKGAENWGPAGDALISVHDAKIQTMQAVLLARSIEQVKVGQRSGREIWDRIYAVTSFYVGLADDLTPYEYLGALDKVFGRGFEPTDLQDEDNLFKLKAELALLPSPKIFGGTGNVFVTPPVTPESLDEVLGKTKGMRFMGQRFIPDSYIFQHLVFPEVLDYTGLAAVKPFTYGFTGVNWARCYPRGLDTMAILGSQRAKAILIEEGDTDYVNYWQQFNKLKAEFDVFDIYDWNQNLYWGWLYALRGLISEFGQGYPNFMRTQAWQKKELNAALSSWTQLRHDTILYAKQSYTPIGTSLPPAVTGYVEPVPEFYGRLLVLTRMTRQGLSDFAALSAQATERLMNLESTLARLTDIADKELRNQPLSEDDYEYIRGFSSTLERAVMGVEEKGLKTTLAADVHTHTAEGKVLEEAVGYVDLIIVACPTPDGSVFLAAGPVLSYYEFKHPMSDRLTDEAWRQMLASFDKNDRPNWFQQLMR